MKNSLKIILAIIFVIILFVGILIMVKPSLLINLINPIELKSTTVLTNISNDNISADIKIGVESSSFVDFVLDSLAYQFYLDSTKIAQGNIQVDKSLGHTEIDTLTIPISMRTKTLTSKLDSMAPTDSTIFRLNLYNYIKFPILGTKSYDINLEKKIPAPKLPKIGIVKIDDLNLKEKSITVDFEIENQSIYKATIVQFNSSIEFIDLFSGKVKSNTQLILKPQSTTRFSATLAIDDLEPIKDGFKMLFQDNRGRSYKMDSQVTLQLEDGSHMDLEIVNSGELAIDINK